MPAHLRPCAPIARDAIVCGDPSRALAIAQAVLPAPRMSNHHRGLWGYYGETGGGGELTVQATGIGGPSAVTVLSELTELGVRRVIRVGTCAVAGRTGAGVAAGGTRRSPATRHLCGHRLEPGGLPDPVLTAALAEGDRRRTTGLISRDLQRLPPSAPSGEPPADLQTAAVAFTRRSRVPTVVVTVTGGRRSRTGSRPLSTPQARRTCALPQLNSRLGQLNGQLRSSGAAQRRSARPQAQSVEIALTRRLRRSRSAFVELEGLPRCAASPAPRPSRLQNSGTHRAGPPRRPPPRRAV